VKDCLRCGKCKPVCSTHVPRANLLYSPRNKIPRVGLLTEAFSTRSRRAAAFHPPLRRVRRRGRPLHRVPPLRGALPGRHRLRRRVDRDANLLAKLRKRRTNVKTWAALQFLNATDPTKIKLVKALMIDIAFRLQRFAHGLRGACSSRASRRATRPQRWARPPCARR
jgi:hypothetical protein